MSLPVLLGFVLAGLVSYFAAWYVLRWMRSDARGELPNTAIAVWWPIYLGWRLAQFLGRRLITIWTSLKVIERVDRLMWHLTKVEVPDSRYDKRPNDRLYQGRKPGQSTLWKEIQTDSLNTGKRIYLSVPPEIVRVRQGLAWGFDISEEDYDPDIAG
jgi:hypothetical protein